MSITRAFTMRNRNPPPMTPPPNGSSSDRFSAFKRMGSVLDRPKISAPVELLSTTNMLSYNAPAVATVRQMRQPSNTSSKSSSSSSGDDSGASSPVRSSSELTDASTAPSSPSSPAPNHLSSYFKAAQENEALQRPRRAASAVNFKRKPLAPVTATGTADPPPFPQRAASHSKSAHVDLARKRSMALSSTANSHGGHAPSPQPSAWRPAAVPPPVATKNEPRASADFFSASFLSAPTPAVAPSAPALSAPAPTFQPHPFGRELAQLDKAVEEMHDFHAASDASVMCDLNLAKFSAAEYLAELRPLYLVRSASSRVDKGTWPEVRNYTTNAGMASSAWL